MTRDFQIKENSEAWKNERDINAVPIEVNRQSDCFFLTFYAENDDEAWILNRAIDNVLEDKSLLVSYEGDKANKNFTGRHQWKAIGLEADKEKELINAIKRRAIEIKAEELVAA